MQENK